MTEHETAFRAEAGLSLAAARRRLGDALERAGVAEGRLEARILLSAATGLDPAALLVCDAEPVGEAGARRLAALASRRLAREPLARILGEREFWGLPFRLSPATLVPRPDTETVVAAALGQVPDRTAPVAILDLGTGSGAILLALLHECRCGWGLGLDRSPEAAATARDNARALGLDGRAAFAVGDWAGALAGRFDLLVSNPPYIRSADIPGLEPEVARHDPGAALDGGPDGLDPYRIILRDAPRLLAPAGAVVLELGHDGAEPVCAIARVHGLAVARLECDLAGHARALVLTRQEGAGR